MIILTFFNVGNGPDSGPRSKHFLKWDFFNDWDQLDLIEDHETISYVKFHHDLMTWGDNIDIFQCWKRA